MKIWVPLDSAAVALGADEVVAAVKAEAARRGVTVELVRNGSRGMIWLEPLAEVEVNGVRHGFGPMTAEDVPGLFGDLGSHPKALGPVGNYAGRMIWRNLGQARRWAFKVRVSDPVEVQISSKGRIA